MAKLSPRNKLIIDFAQAKSVLLKAQARAVELEKTNPQAFVEIRQAKSAVSSANLIVSMYDKMLNGELKS
jgi:hypothetical protein